MFDVVYVIILYYVMKGDLCASPDNLGRKNSWERRKKDHQDSGPFLSAS